MATRPPKHGTGLNMSTSGGAGDLQGRREGSVDSINEQFNELQDMHDKITLINQNRPHADAGTNKYRRTQQRSSATAVPV